MIFRLVLAGALAALAGPVHAQSCDSGGPAVTGSAGWSAYKSWCHACGGTVANDLNTAQAEGGCKLPSSAGGVSGGYTPTEEAAQAIGTTLGNAIGGALHEALFGSPEQEARRAAEAERARAELLRREQADEARKQRLLTEMQDVDNAGELQMMTDDAPRRTPKRTPKQDLIYGTWLSQHVWTATSPEAAARANDVAFHAALGEAVDAKVPDAELQRAIGASQQKEFEALRELYRKALAASAADGTSLVELDYQKEVAAKVLIDAERKLAQLKTDESRALRDEAKALVARIDTSSRKARADAEARQAQANEAAQSLQVTIGPDPGRSTAAQKSPEFLKGLLDGEQCFSANGSLFCGTGPASAMDQCMKDYAAGYAKGEKEKAAALQVAADIGRRDRSAGRRASGPAQFAAQGSCRVAWIEAYDDGFFGARLNLIGR